MAEKGSCWSRFETRVSAANASRLLQCLSSSCGRFGVLNLLYVSFQVFLCVTAQLALPLDLLKELENLGSDGVMTAQECHGIRELPRSTRVLFQERFQQDGSFLIRQYRAYDTERAKSLCYYY
jgi:hypothetical protein